MARSKSFPDSVDPGMPVLPACPSGWAQRKFGDVLRAIERPIALDEEMTYTLVNAKRSRGGIVLRDRKPGKEVKVPTQFIVREGDFVISRRQIIHGACGIVPRDLDGAIVSNEYLVLNSTDELSTKYLSYFSHTPYFQRTCFHSSVGVDVEKMVFKEDQWFQFPFPLPPLPEQKKIAAILSSVDETIAKTEAVIAQLQIVKKAMMEQLLTKGMPGRHTRFKQTEIGEIPEEWEVVELGSVGEWLSGGTPSKSDPHLWAGSVPWVSPKDMKRPRLGDAEDHVHEDAIGNGTRLVPADTLLMVVRGMILAHTFPVCLTTASVTFNQDIKALRPSVHFEPEFLLYWLQGSQSRVLEITEVANHGTKRIPTEQLHAMGVPLPSLPEQQGIVHAIRSLEVLIGKTTDEKRELQAVKSSLSSSLLSGEIRVIPEVA